jgi:hypothetical protein
VVATMALAKGTKPANPRKSSYARALGLLGQMASEGVDIALPGARLDANVDGGSGSRMAQQGPGMNRRARPTTTTAPPRGASSLIDDARDARRRLSAKVAEFRVGDEKARTRLIGDICCLLREPAIPESARSAGLELIGWLARRMPGEAAHALGVEEAQEALRAGRRKAR